MARFKDFDAAESERKGEPITFALGGQEWTAAHVNAANFLAFSRQIAEGGEKAFTGFDDYITSTLQEDQREDFHVMLAKKDVQLATLMDLGRWIVEQASGNPTAAASPSPARPSKSGRPSRRYSLDPVSKPKGSLSVVG
jgi:hypothetical protein